MEKQNETLATQRFENTFFHIVNLHHQIINSFKIGSGVKTKEGREVVHTIYSMLEKRYKREFLNIEEIEEIYTETRNVYNDYYLKYFDTHLGHYFRNLYHIFKLIETSNIKEDQKKQYAALVRAQLSSYELIMLFYNGISEYGEKLYQLMIKYDLLQNMNEDLIVNTHQKNIYDHLGEFNRIAYILAIYTGMRKGEILGLRWKDIDMESQRLSIRQTI